MQTSPQWDDVIDCGDLVVSGMRDARLPFESDLGAVSRPAISGDREPSRPTRSHLEGEP